MKREWGGVLCLGLLSLVLFGPALFLEQALFFRDIVHYYWPTREAVREAWAAGAIPQWMGSPFGGVPLLADPHAGVLYPLNAVFALLPFHRAYAFCLALHHLAGGLGMYWLLRRATGNAWAGGAAALAFMASGYVVGLSSAGPLMAGLAYVPWVLVVLTREVAWARKVALVGLLCGLQALSGDPQSVLYSGMVSLAWIAWQGERRVHLAVMGAGLMLAGVLAALQLLPAWHLLQASTRAGGASTELAAWTLPFARLLELFLPFPYGGYLEEPRFWAGFTVTGPARIPFALSVYLGASTLVLGLLGLRRSRWCGFGLTLLALGLLLALGAQVGLGALYTDVPPFRFFRYPEKYIVLTTLGWAVLVGLGVARVLDGAALPRRRLLLVGSILVVVGLAALGLAVLREPALRLAGGVIEATGARASAAQPVDAARRALQTALLFGGLSLVAVALLRRQPRRPLLAALLLGVMAVDLVGAAGRVLWFGGTELFTREPPLAAELLRRAPLRPSRIWRDNEALKAAVPGSRSVDELYQSRLWELATLKSNLPSRFGLEELSGYGAVQLRRHTRLAEALARQPARLSELLNGCFLVSSLDAPSLQGDTRVERVLQATELRISVWRLRRCLPRLRAVERLTALRSAEDAERRLAAADFEPSVEAVVEGGQSARFAPAGLSGVEYGPAWVTATARVPAGGGFLVLANSFYPGWEVRVDGEPAALLPTNLATLGVRLEEGEHRVEFHYREPWLAVGGVSSALGLLAALALLWRSRRSREAEAPPAPDPLRGGEP